jgi:hypothetical protein
MCPTIVNLIFFKIPKVWEKMAKSTWIKVELFTIAQQPHPYHINNKSAKAEWTEDSLIYRDPNQPNTLIFRVTDSEFQLGKKT